MATSSRVPQLIDALLAALTAAAGLDGVKVVDGPLVSNTSASEFVFVGYDGDPEGEFQTAQTTQQWAGLGARAKNEDITITGAVLVQRGDIDVKAVRDRVFAIFAEVEAAVRADPALGLGTPTVCSVSETSFHTEQTDHGVQGRLPFTLTCSTRI
jgi:hypothetical protein